MFPSTSDLRSSSRSDVRRVSRMGLIEQAPLAIYFETKLGNAVWLDQIERHIDGIAGEVAGKRTVLLVGLTREPTPEAEDNALRQNAEARGVNYRSLTFSRVLEDLRATCASHDEALLRILDDYQDFLEQEGLLDQRGKRMAVIPCGSHWLRTWNSVSTTSHQAAPVDAVLA